MASLASPRSRLAAAGIDVLPAVGVAVLVSILVVLHWLPSSGAVLLAGLLLVLYAACQWWAYAVHGAGFGARAVGIKVLSQSDKKPLGWIKTLLRFLVAFLLVVSVVGGVILFWMLGRDKNCQGWHDHLVESVVVDDSPEGVNLKTQQQSLAAKARTSSELFQGSAYGPYPGNRSTASIQPTPDHASSDEATQEQLPTPRTPQKAWIPLPTPSSVIKPSAENNDAAAGNGSNRSSSEHGWYLLLDDGREVELLVPVLLGRNPQKSPGDPKEVHLVPASGDGRMISRTHVFIGFDEHGVFVIDRASTNGTALVQPIGGLEPCVAGVPVRVSENQRVSYGDRYFTVLRHPAQSAATR